MKNLPVVYKPRSWSPFKMSPEVQRVLGVMFSAFRVLFVLRPKETIIGLLLVIGATTTIGAIMGASSTVESKPIVYVIPQPERGPSFAGNESSYVGEEGERAGTETSEPVPPMDEAPVKKYPTTSPRTSVDLSPAQFIAKYAPIAQKLQRKYGVPASVTLGQGLLESNNGNSDLARKANNFFGIKCFAKRHRACCIKACDDSNNDSFVIFDNPTAAFEGHSKFLQKDRYKGLKKYGKNYRQWAFGLKSKGYATNPKYAYILIGLIERYDLHKYDR